MTKSLHNAVTLARLGYLARNIKFSKEDLYDKVVKILNRC